MRSTSTLIERTAIWKFDCWSVEEEDGETSWRLTLPDDELVATVGCQQEAGWDQFFAMEFSTSANYESESENLEAAKTWCRGHIWSWRIFDCISGFEEKICFGLQELGLRLCNVSCSFGLESSGGFVFVVEVSAVRGLETVGEWFELNMKNFTRVN